MSPFVRLVPQATHRGGFVTTDLGPTKVASIAVFNSMGHLLFGRRRDNKRFTLPGGHFEPGERPYAAAVRELKEETGLECLLDSLGSEVIKDGKLEIHAFVGMCDSEEASSHLDPDDECDEWKWVDVADGLPEEIAGNLHAPRNVTLQLLDLQDPLEKGLKEALKGPALTAAVGLAAGLGLGSQMPKERPQPTPQVRQIEAPPQQQPVAEAPQQQGPKQWKMSGLHPDLQRIAYLETRGRHDEPHAAHSKGDWHTAHGAVGFKPVSGYDQYRRSQGLQAAHPGLNETTFAQKFKEDPDFYNEVASDHWLWLKAKLKTPERTAYAWRFGRKAALDATDAEIAKSGYVKAFGQVPTKVAKSEADVYRALRHPDAKEQQLAQSMVGIGPDHISWAIHNKDSVGRPTIANLDLPRLLPVIDGRTWGDLIANAPESQVLELLATPEAHQSLVSHLDDQLKEIISEKLTGPIDSARRFGQYLLPVLPAESVAAVFQHLADTSPVDKPEAENPLLSLLRVAGPAQKAHLSEAVKNRLWESFILPNRWWHAIPDDFALTDSAHSAILKDFDSHREPAVLLELARLKHLTTDTVKEITSRLGRLSPGPRAEVCRRLVSNGHLSPDEGDAGVLLATSPMAKSEAIQDGVRRLSPEIYRLYRAACAVFAVTPEADDAEVLKLRSAMLLNDGDVYSAVLFAVGVDDTEENRAAVRAASGMMPLVKSEGPPVPLDSSVEPLSSTAFDVADDIARHIEDSRPAHLDGKHSKGSFFVDTPSGTWFLKPGAGRQSPIMGMTDDPIPASAREAAFWAVSVDWGLSSDLTRAEWVKINDQPYAAIRFLPAATYSSLVDEMDDNHAKTYAALEAYRQKGRLWQWGVMDYVLGNGDRHEHNLMISKDGEIKLIDHGSAFAGRHFDPAVDVDSFTPYYLRFSAPDDVNFTTLRPRDKLMYMPDLPTSVQGRLRSWLMSLNPEQLKHTLGRFGINPLPVLARLERVKNAGSDLAGYLNRLWVLG